MHRGTVHDEGGNGVNGKSIATVEVYNKIGEEKVEFPRIRTFINFDNSDCKYKKGDIVSFNIFPAKVEQLSEEDVGDANGWLAVITDKHENSLKNTIRTITEEYGRKIIPVAVSAYILLLAANYLTFNLLGSLFFENSEMKSFSSNVGSNLLTELSHVIILGLIIVLWKGRKSLVHGARMGFILGLLFGIVLIINCSIIGCELSPCELLFYILSYILKLTLAGAVIGRMLYSEALFEYGQVYERHRDDDNHSDN